MNARAGAVRPRRASGLVRLSDGVARAEAALAAVLVAGLAGLILLNVVTRASGTALFWVDEAAIYCMVWAAFLGASVTIHDRSAVAIDLLAEALPPGAARALGRLIQVVIAVFGIALLALAWRWFAPVAIARAGFDAGVLAAETFNFIYREPTVTMGGAKWPIWLVMPLFGATVTLHAAANLAAGPQARPGPGGPD